MPELSERDMRILAFERRGWRSSGVKEQAIAEVLDMPATRYYQLLNELIDRPEALHRALEMPDAERQRRGAALAATAAADPPARWLGGQLASLGLGS